MHRRSTLQAGSDQVIRMLFVPSVEQGTLVRRGDDLARFIRQDCGLMLRSEVPTSYAAVIQALGSGQADVAWIPAFAYVLANVRYDAQARLQVVRAVDLQVILVARNGAHEPAQAAGLAGRQVAIPSDMHEQLRQVLIERLDQVAPGWSEVSVASDREAVRALVSDPDRAIAAAASSYVFSGDHDMVGDGRKQLEYERPGTLLETRIIARTEEPVAAMATTYYGCILARTDSGVHRLEDISGRSFAFSDETSTSGHIFARVLLNRTSVALGHEFYAGGHPNVVQAVADGKVVAGSAFYSPPGRRESEDQTFVGDARRLILKRMDSTERRLAFLEEVRIIALTDPIPNDLCCIRKGFSESTWERFAASLQRFLDTEDGRAAYYELVAGVAAAPCTDREFDGFREALKIAGVSASKLLEAAEARLNRQRSASGGGS
jgi:ABC-type phosphate/phosphonate transport system substrate-binding protein